MKTNYYDKVLDKVEFVTGKVSDKIAGDFKNTNPFDKKPIPVKELAEAYNSLTIADMRELVIKHGEEAVNDFVYEIEQYLKRRSTNG